MTTISLATGQRSLGDPDISYPLWPPLTHGCPRTGSDTMSYPLEIDYDYTRVTSDFVTGQGRPRCGLDRWAPLLPPLPAPGLGEGGTPLIAIGDGVYVDTEAYGIACPVNSYRGVRAITGSEGRALTVDDAAMHRAQAELAGQGLWVELSFAAGLAGLRTLPDGETIEGPVVCVTTSSGFKDARVGDRHLAPVDPSWENVRTRLRAEDIRS
ncbi:hypothetical protein ABTZ98_03675 [Streptomyces bacillaris]